MLDKVLGVLKDIEWTVMHAGFAIKPFDWRFEGRTERYNVMGYLGPIRMWAGFQ